MIVLAGYKLVLGSFVKIVSREEVDEEAFYWSLIHTSEMEYHKDNVKTIISCWTFDIIFERCRQYRIDNNKINSQWFKDVLPSTSG